MNFCRDNLNARIVTCAIKIVGLKLKKFLERILNIIHNLAREQFCMLHHAHLEIKTLFETF